jgi:hypothetical protein
MRKGRVLVIAAVLAPVAFWVLSELSRLIAEQLGCKLGFKSMRACELLGTDISSPLWAVHYGGSFLVYVTAVISLATAIGVVMYRFTGVLPRFHGHI